MCGWEKPMSLLTHSISGGSAIVRLPLCTRESEYAHARSLCVHRKCVKKVQNLHISTKSICAIKDIYAFVSVSACV